MIDRKLILEHLEKPFIIWNPWAAFYFQKEMFGVNLFYEKLIRRRERKMMLRLGIVEKLVRIGKIDIDSERN